MNTAITTASRLLRAAGLTSVALLCIGSAALAAERPSNRLNEYGATVLGPDGKRVSYSQEELARAAESVPEGRATVTSASSVPDPAGFVGTVPGAARPFWQYSIFGSGIGASNIVIKPAAGGGREIIIGGNSGSGFGANDFWHVLRRNPASGNYDQVFVSSTYGTSVERIAVGNVTGDAQEEIVVMLANGRIYLYDLATKNELGYITTGLSGLEGLSLANLDLDNLLELVVTTPNDLYAFDGAGVQLWQVAGAGGYDVVVGQMDNDVALEIATTKGTVTDAVTRTVQWTRAGGFGSYLRLAPFPGENYQQLIAAQGWDYVYSYDVARQLPRWSINEFDIDAIEVADVDNDGTPEVIIGDGQWGTVHVHDLMTQAKKWETPNPEHGVTNIAVGDVDADGVVDLVWGAGWTSSGADYLYVSSTTGNHAIKWQSVDLGGPFAGPALGDLDGDAQVELVVCSWESESGYDSGRILVFDIETMALRGISAPIIQNRAWTGVRDLKLRDVDGDGRMDIILAADHLYDGTIEIYGFELSNTFTLKWTNTTRPSGSPFNFVEVADLDGNGTAEIIAGNTVAHTGSEGVYVHIFDYPSTTRSWRSVNMAANFSSVNRLVVEDLDGDGGKEIAALVSGGDLYTFEGSTRQLEDLKQQTNATLMTSRRSPAGLILGDTAGVGHFMQYLANDYIENFSRQLGTGTLDGINVLPNGGLWTGNAGVLSLRVPPSYDSVQWQSPVFGTRFGRYVATDFRDNVKRVFSSAQHAVAGFTYQSPLAEATPPPKVVPSPTPTPSPTATPKPTPTPTPWPWPTPTPSPGFSPSPTASPSPTVSPSPSASPAPSPSPTPAATPRRLGNISTRLRVEPGDNALIGGFIIIGSEPKRLMLRAIGPSMAVEGALADPQLQIVNSEGHEIAFNNNWREAVNRQEMIETTIQPSHDAESAVLMSLSPGAYTAVVRGVGDATGVGSIEAYDLGQGAATKLANISTRGFVQTGDNVMIGGFFILGATQKVIVRAIGPSLELAGPLADPTLQLFNDNGDPIASNNDWRETQEREIEETTIPPRDNRESAIVASLPPSSYTAIVRGAGDTIGVALVEVYALD